MRARYPVWLVLPGEELPGRHRLETVDDRYLAEGPEEGLLKVLVPPEDAELVFTDVDVELPGGDGDALISLVPPDEADEHYNACSPFRCPHDIGRDRWRYAKTDAGWYLVVHLGDGRSVWVHELDVPVDNDPRYHGLGRGHSGFGRRRLTSPG